MNTMWNVCVRLAAAAMLLTTASAAGDTGDRLYELLDARLELMDEVAAYKWHAGRAVEDLEREAVVLDRAVDDALRYGFTPASSRAFFTAQIEAAKQIQRYWFQRWERGDAPGRAPDLHSVIRPQLLRLGEEILEAAAGFRGPSSPEAFEAAVAVTGLGDDTRAAVHRTLTALERFPSRLDQILATGVLRIGTTGDYAPFSHRTEASSAPVGIDIDLGRRLARALGVKAEFVATSWPTLMGDLAAGRYDIAMSGVSRIVDRQKFGYFSSGYYAGGKMPIARCGDAGRFDSLSAVDRRGVRVIVNPGGTNERFLDTHVQQARKILHEDNRTIFEALAGGDADVMITDRVEVELQAARHASLCATMTEPLTYQEKAYLMPRDAPLKELVETWLSLVLADGTVAAVFRDHGVTPRPPNARR